MKAGHNLIAPGVNQNVESTFFGSPRASKVPTQIEVNTRIGSRYDFDSDDQRISSSNYGTSNNAESNNDLHNNLKNC